MHSAVLIEYTLPLLQNMLAFCDPFHRNSFKLCKVSIRTPFTGTVTVRKEMLL